MRGQNKNYTIRGLGVKMPTKISKRKPHLEETKKKISLSNTGKLSSQWKGDDAKYQALHSYIHNHFGKANHCENDLCEGKSKEYQWALKPNSTYSRNIKDYFQLCRSCHRKMDMTNKTKEKISKKLTKHIGCKIKGCLFNHLSKGYCQYHYNIIVRKKNK